MARTPYGKVTKHKTHHIQENQEVTPFPPGDYNAARQFDRQTLNANKKNKSTAIKWSVRKLLEHLHVFQGTSLSKVGCKDQESIQSSTTPDPGYQWESDKITVCEFALFVFLVSRNPYFWCGSRQIDAWFT